MEGIQLPQGYEEAVYFLPLSSQKFEIPGIYSFDQAWKDERLSRTWGHSMVLNTGPLD